jgi:hypothetical protein
MPKPPRSWSICSIACERSENISRCQSGANFGFGVLKVFKCRVSSVVEQRFCKPLVGGSNPSPGTSRISDLLGFLGSRSSQTMQLGRLWEDEIKPYTRAAVAAGAFAGA